MNAEKSPDSRIAKHAVLWDMPAQKKVTIFFEGKALAALEGEPIMAALVAAGVTVFRYTKKGSPRRMFCGIGRCTDCVMTVDGVPGVRTCVTEVRDGMKVERQHGVGSWSVQAEAGHA
ncbi:MAG: (2Fe-2S)-binding protein [Spirochaetia bacterium]|jgi:predicted molibdopterin-dependent oxidoreductase YjgC|nr:(2Fe-2S)-binding protein [Spirochaetia bacterium]